MGKAQFERLLPHTRPITLSSSYAPRMRICEAVQELCLSIFRFPTRGIHQLPDKVRNSLSVQFVSQLLDILDDHRPETSGCGLSCAGDRWPARCSHERTRTTSAKEKASQLLVRYVRGAKLHVTRSIRFGRKAR